MVSGNSWKSVALTWRLCHRAAQACRRNARRAECGDNRDAQLGRPPWARRAHSGALAAVMLPRGKAQARIAARGGETLRARALGGPCFCVRRTPPCPRAQERGPCARRALRGAGGFKPGARRRACVGARNRRPRSPRPVHDGRTPTHVSLACDVGGRGNRHTRLQKTGRLTAIPPKQEQADGTFFGQADTSAPWKRVGLVELCCHSCARPPPCRSSLQLRPPSLHLLAMALATQLLAAPARRLEA